LNGKLALDVDDGPFGCLERNSPAPNPQPCYRRGLWALRAPTTHNCATRLGFSWIPSSFTVFLGSLHPLRFSLDPFILYGFPWIPSSFTVFLGSFHPLRFFLDPFILNLQPLAFNHGLKPGTPSAYPSFTLQALRFESPRHISQNLNPAPLDLGLWTQTLIPRTQTLVLQTLHL